MNNIDELMNSLLRRFRECEAYEDRLQLWQEFGLTKQLFYNLYEKDKGEEFRFSTWEELKEMPILTLTPFSHEEAEIFTDWALHIRPGGNEAVGTFELKKNFVTEQLAKIEFDNDKHFFLKSYTQQIENNKRADFTHYGGSKAAQYMLGIDVATYIEIVSCLRSGIDFPLSHRIWQRENLSRYKHMDWQLIDSYLYAEAIIKTSNFLAKLSSGSSPVEDASIRTNPTMLDIRVPSKIDALTKRQRVLLHFYEGGNMVDRKHKDYDDYISVSSPRKRLAYCGESKSKANYFIKDIEKIIPMLSEKAKQDAEREMITVMAKFTAEN